MIARNQYLELRYEDVAKLPLAINRFTVMSILQAARAETMGLSHDSALSWGLNRAIFFAAAKRGFKGGGGGKPSGERAKADAWELEKGTYYLGEDMAYTDESQNKLYFKIGDKTQTPEDFKAKIESRFPSEKLFKKAWDEAIKIVKGYDQKTLRSGEAFYGEVYKPRRDLLVEKWKEMIR